MIIIITIIIMIFELNNEIIIFDVVENYDNFGYDREL